MRLSVAVGVRSCRLFAVRAAASAFGPVSAPAAAVCRAAAAAGASRRRRGVDATCLAPRNLPSLIPAETASVNSALVPTAPSSPPGASGERTDRPNVNYRKHLWAAGPGVGV